MASILDELRAERLFPAYLIFGTEFYLQQRAKDLITKLALEGADRSLNYDHFSGAEPNAAKEAVTVAHTVPFAAEKRVVVLTEVDKAWHYEDRKNKAEGKKFLLNYLSQPIQSTVLIMTSEESPPKELVKATSKVGRAEEFKPPVGASLKKWIKAIAYEHGKDIEQKAVDLLAQLVGPDLLSMNQEVQKAALYAARKKTITVDDVIATGIKHKLESIFTLIDMVANKRAAEALKLMNEILAYEKPTHIISLIARQMRIIWRSKKLAKSGYTPSQITKELKLPAFLAPRLATQMNKFNIAQLQSALSLCARIDRELKTSPTPKNLLLERLILDICWMEQS